MSSRFEDARQARLESLQKIPSEYTPLSVAVHAGGNSALLGKDNRFYETYEGDADPHFGANVEDIKNSPYMVGKNPGFLRRLFQPEKAKEITRNNINDYIRGEYGDPDKLQGPIDENNIMKDRWRYHNIFYKQGFVKRAVEAGVPYPQAVQAAEAPSHNKKVRNLMLLLGGAGLVGSGMAYDAHLMNQTIPTRVYDGP